MATNSSLYVRLLIAFLSLNLCFLSFEVKACTFPNCSPFGSNGRRLVDWFNEARFPRSEGNAPVMENVQRRSCLSAANFPYLPVLGTPPAHKVNRLSRREARRRRRRKGSAVVTATGESGQITLWTHGNVIILHALLLLIVFLLFLCQEYLAVSRSDAGSAELTGVSFYLYLLDLVFF